MRKQPVKKKQGIYHIHGLNGCSNIIQDKKLNIIRIDLMVGGIAEKKKWINNLKEIKSYQIHRMPKDQFLKKYPGKRTQGIVISFRGEIMKNVPSFTNLDNNECRCLPSEQVL